MSWEEASLRTHLIPSRLPELSEVARREMDALRNCIEALQDRRTGPRSLQEAKFMLSQVQAQEERCKKAIEEVRGCRPSSEGEEQVQRRLLSSLSLALDDHIGSLQQDIQQDSPDVVQAHLHSSAAGLAWESAFRAELLAEQSHVERSLAELRTLLGSTAAMVKVQGDQLDRLDINLGIVSENVGKGTVELENSDRSQQSEKRKLVGAFLLVLVVVIVLVLVLVLKQN